MTRWPPDAADRLRAAAMELFVENGFAATTVPEITARAGMTTRSFFRYYADKREVLFVGEDELPAIVKQIFTEADPELTPMQVILGGMRSFVLPRFVRLREELLSRRAIVQSDAGLIERELRKRAILHDAAVSAFTERGLSRVDAEVAGRLSVAVYDSILELWLSDGATADPYEVLTEVEAAIARASGVAPH